uniref:Rac GTPase-activating protein 1 n=1 Tax=Cyclopterus lumpus TaxID=8103 RepID=A0A8C2YY33_CYCLU
MRTKFLQMAVNFEECRKKWVRAGDELVSCKEVLVKAETERGALEVKLKHARNQVDVEIRRRQKAESVYEKLERQLQLIRDLLISENSGNSVHLSEEQRSALAFLSAHSQAAQAAKSNLNTSRRSDAPPLLLNRFHMRMNESIVAKTTITIPGNGGAVEAVSTIQTLPYWTDRQSGLEAPSTTVSASPAQPRTPRPNAGGKKHQFTPKTVIRSEFCAPCGRRTKFGKMYLRCQDCKVVTHPECRDYCPLPCNPLAVNTPVANTESTLADFAPVTSPKIPVLVLYCIKEIEHRGLHEVGLYRVSGQERVVKELKEKLIRGKIVPPLHKVDDINVVAGALKDFLRNLPEPLLTFHLNRVFMEAAEIQDDGNSLAVLYQTISELPQPNRDTLACLMIHLQKVSQCVDTKMDVHNLARVFGPTLVGHAVPDPDPMTILQDTSRQPRVVERLLSIPANYWDQFASPENTGMEDAHHAVSILGPVTTPEHQMMAKTPSSGSLSQRMKQTLSSTTIFGSKSKASAASNRPGNFFASPQLK